MLTVRNRNTNLAEDVKGNGNGAITTEQTPRYRDLGLVIDAENVAAGATVLSPWYDGLDWVRHQIYFSQSTQAFSAGYTPRDSATMDSLWQFNPVDVAAQTEPIWRVSAITGSVGLTGHSARFRMKNNSEAAAAYMRLRVQMLG